MKTTLATFVLLSFTICSVLAHEKEITRKPGLFYTPRPGTLVQEAAFSVIKKTILDDVYKKTVNPDLLPIDIKDTIAIADALSCMQKLNSFQEFAHREDDNLVILAYNQSYVNQLTTNLNAYEKQVRTCLNAENQKTILQNMQLITHKISYLHCVKDAISRILSDENLSYLLLRALNDRNIAHAVFGDNNDAIKNIINSFVDLLILKDKSYIVKKLLSYPELRKLVISRLIELYLLDDEFVLVTNAYTDEIYDSDFVDTLHDLLLDFFKTVSSADLVTDKLGNYILTTFVTHMPYLTDDYKELLNSLFDHLQDPTFTFGQGHTSIPYEFWLFEYLHNDPDLFNNKIKEIIYFLEKGLTLEALKMPITAQDNFVIQRAKRNYELLKQREPAVIKKFAEAQHRYQERKK